MQVRIVPSKEETTHNINQLQLPPSLGPNSLKMEEGEVVNCSSGLMGQNPGLNIIHAKEERDQPACYQHWNESTPDCIAE